MTIPRNLSTLAQGASSVGVLSVSYGGTGTTSLTSGYLVKGNGTSAASASVVYDNGTNVGIGTSSITAIYGKTLQIASGSTEGSLSIVGSTGNGYVATVGSAFTVAGRGGMALSLGTNDTERMRIDSSGNVGIGTSSPVGALTVVRSSSSTTIGGSTAVAQIGNSNGGSFGLTAGIELFGSGAPSSGNGNRSAAIYGVYTGYNASGNAGDLVFATNALGATSVTERMRIDSSGNVGIGCTPSERLEIAKSTAPVLKITNSSASGTAGNAAYMILNCPQGTATFFRAILATADNGSNYDWAIGNMGTAKDNLAFYTGGINERMRIDSSGNLLVGTTTNLSAKIAVVSDTTTAIFGQSSGNTSATYPIILRNSDAVNLLFVRSDGYVAMPAVYSTWTSGSAANLGIDSSGGLYRSVSSLKYKRDVQNATHGLAEVMQLRPVTYKGKSENDSDTVFGGLIAEEVHAVGLTEFVQYADDGSPDALAYGNMVSLLVKAIQELSAKVAALEGSKA